MMSTDQLQQIVHSMAEHKNIFSAVLKVKNSTGSIDWTGAAGNMSEESKYFIASVTKLYMTAIVMGLIEEGKIELDHPISKYLPDDLCKGLHLLKGRDYSDQIQVLHLISNTSGIPDYFFHKQPDGKTVADSLMSGIDEPWPLEKSISLIKELKPNFTPGAKGKVAYSDSNYQLLGRIIEEIEEKKLSKVFQDRLFIPLQLKDTYTYADLKDTSPTPFYYGAKELWLPHYMASITSEGGLVSTAEEVMIFTQAFFNGKFFPKERLNELKQWRLLFPPPGLFYFGIGLERLFIPWIVSPFKPIKDVIGFWGQTGSFAFYHEKSDLYFTGTTNQINGAGHRAAGSAIFKIIKSAL